MAYDSRGIRKIKKLQTFTSIGANIANILVVLGLGLGLLQWCQARQLDAKRIALEAVNRTKDQDFLRIFARLKTLSRHATSSGIAPQVLEVIYGTGDHNKNVIRLTDDMNFVVSTYDHIAMLLLNSLGDQDILRQGVSPEVHELSKIFKAFEPVIPGPIWRRNCDKMLKFFQDIEALEEKQHRKKYEIHDKRAP